MVDKIEPVDEAFVVRLRGLPWSASFTDIERFLAPATVIEHGVHFTSSREGRPSGEAFVELQTNQDFKTALEKHKKSMGHRYVEVFRSRKSEMDWVLKRAGTDDGESQDAVVRLRGLPFGCSKEEISQFFSGLEIVPNGITLPQDSMGRTTGDAYVQFSSPDIVEQALQKHKQRIGHRYIEIFKSSLNEARNLGPMRTRGSMGPPNRMGPYDRAGGFGGRGGGRGGMMGPRMPDFGGNITEMIVSTLTGQYRGFEGDMDRFDRGGPSRDFGSRGRRPMGGMMRGGGDIDGGFGGPRGGGFGGSREGGQGGGGRGGFGGGSSRPQPGSNYNSRTGHWVHMRGLPFSAIEADINEFFAPIVPVHVELGKTPTGRASGEADVDFASHADAVQAMSRDKAHMERRYIELFLNSRDEEKRGSGPDDGGMRSMGGDGMMGHDGANQGQMGGMIGPQLPNSNYSSENMGGGNFGGNQMVGGNMGVENVQGNNMKGGNMGAANMGEGMGNSSYASGNGGYNQNSSGYGQSNSGYGPSNSGYGQNSSGYGQSNSGYGQGYSDVKYNNMGYANSTGQQMDSYGMGQNAAMGKSDMGGTGPNNMGGNQQGSLGGQGNTYGGEVYSQYQQQTDYYGNSGSQQYSTNYSQQTGQNYGSNNANAYSQSYGGQGYGSY